MHGSNLILLFISQHLPLSLFSWKSFRDVNFVVSLGLIEEILIKSRRRGFFILKKKGCHERVWTKVYFRLKMMVIFFFHCCICQQSFQNFYCSCFAGLAFLPEYNQPIYRNYQLMDTHGQWHGSFVTTSNE